MNITASAKKLLQAQLAALKTLAANGFEWRGVSATECILDRVEAAPDSSLKLWFVKDTHPEFDTDRDLLLYAVDVREATVIWREYYETDLEDEPKSVKEVPAGAKVAGAIPWGKLA